MCVRNTDRGAMGGRDTGDQVSHGKLVVKEYPDTTLSTRGEQRMLRNPDQGERYGACSDHVAQHLGGSVGPLPVTPWVDRSLLSFH